MGDKEPERPKAMKNGIIYTRDFEIVEMSDLAADKSRGQFTTTTSYSVSTMPRPAKSSRKQSLGRRWADSFRRVPGLPISGHHGYHINDGLPGPVQVGAQAGDRFYDLRAANARTANSALARDLKGRHLQMIAIGGSIGTGLFVASGMGLYQSGPAPMLLAYMVTGAFQFCTMQSLGELVVTFPVAGSFAAFSTRFLDPSWGFAIGWNYALQWLFALPLEIIAGAMTIQYWNASLNMAIFVTIFLLTIIGINLFGIKGYGEAEFLFSTVKVTAIVGFILLGIVINIGGTPHGGYIGGKYWVDPGATHNGFKGFCSVLANSSFAFGGTELVGLAAAETANPRKSLPSAIKQVFWRIAIFYVVTLLLVGLLVPYNEPRLLGGQSSVDASASPFVIAVESAGSTILPSVMNAVIMVAVLSVGNSAVSGSSRTLAALAEQSHAPKIFSYVDRKGRPLAAITFALALGLMAYLADVKDHSEIFDWMFAICGLSSLFTWGSICLCHIRFRRAWAAAGHTLEELPFRSQAGIIGSCIGLIGNGLVLASQVWLGISPLQIGDAPLTPSGTAKNFFLSVMAVPIIFICYIGHKVWFRTKVLSIPSMDIDTGRSFSRVQSISTEE
ncbi:General amino-acid permease GAP1 [Tolypocladium ophioglossoides CBS 100239]|uniref:General amino-acid permease GAP1 n=1 Tax=Tolypocladium ophioglossoides (strain CBS 100239) TaxID=1163406 RepID=A0A0L0N5S9_TOLOC|nr:General amino-acid permease GAP1 [Tolypocladium ophioglossoides CBS 100239]